MTKGKEEKRTFTTIRTYNGRGKNRIFRATKIRKYVRVIGEGKEDRLSVDR